MSVRIRLLFTALCLFCLLLSGCAKAFLAPEVEYASEGRIDKVIEYLEEQDRRGVKLTSKRINSLCRAYYQTKDYERTLACFDRLQVSIDSGDTSWPRGNLELSRLAVLLDLGQYDQALSRAKALLSRLSPRDGRVQMLTIYAGMASALAGDHKAAREYAARYEVVKTKDDASLVLQSQDLALSGIYLALQDGPNAYRIMRRSKDDAQSSMMKGIVVFMSGNMDIFRGMDMAREFMLAKSAMLAGKTDEARQRYDQLLANPLSSLDGYNHWQMLGDRGAIALADGQPGLAVEHLAKAVEVIEAQRRTIGSEASKMGFVGDKQSVYRNIVAALLANGQPERAFEYAERAKARALVDLLAERSNLAPPDQDGSATALTQLAGLERQYVRQSASAAPEEAARLRSALSGLRQDIRKQAPELASLVSVSAPRAAEIQAKLAPDETLLEYYGQGDDLYAFSVTREAVRAVKLDGQGLEAEVRALRSSIEQVRGEAWRQPARALYNRLMAPVPGALDKPRLVIVGHGALHYLPWGALYDGQKSLVDRAALTFLPSASVMQFLAARGAAPARNLLVLGNPDLGDTALDLPGAEAEARAIKGIWPDAVVLLRKAAAKSALTKAGSLFRVIHVAAHGEFVSDQPLNSRLLLAPEGSDNGQLTAGDLYGLRLNADLVTLSACETGLGKVLSGDDVVGLTRGFLYAGAHSIVASLWPVSDEETKHLMSGFYRNLKTMPKADALRAAQLDTKRKYPHPFYWSAFQLTGMGR